MLRARAPCALPLAPSRARPHAAAPARRHERRLLEQAITKTRGGSLVARFQPTSDARLSKRQAELAVRKLYLFNFWYAAGFCKNVRSDAFLATKLLDTHVLIWRSRSTGRLLCVTDECPCTGQRISDSVRAPIQGPGKEELDIMCVAAPTLWCSADIETHIASCNTLHGASDEDFRV